MTTYLDPLPYPENALSPLISEETVRCHYGRHHADYAIATQRLVAGTRYANWPLEEIVAATRFSYGEEPIFNNAAQTWNHAFYWASLAPFNENTLPTGAFLQRIERDYGSFVQLKKALVETATLRFGSGWLWLVDACGRLDIRLSANAETMCANPAATPLLALDLWEHAYYIDWRNHRGDYVNAVVNHLIDWRVLTQRYDKGNTFLQSLTLSRAATAA